MAVDAPPVRRKARLRKGAPPEKAWEAGAWPRAGGTSDATRSREMGSSATILAREGGASGGPPPSAEAWKEGRASSCGDGFGKGLERPPWMDSDDEA